MFWKHNSINYKVDLWFKKLYYGRKSIAIITVLVMVRIRSNCLWLKSNGYPTREKHLNLIQAGNETQNHLPYRKWSIQIRRNITAPVKIGEERTETLKFLIPASLVKKITIERNMRKGWRGVIIGRSCRNTSHRKGIAEARLAHIRCQRW